MLWLRNIFNFYLEASHIIRSLFSSLIDFIHIQHCKHNRREEHKHQESIPYLTRSIIWESDTNAEKHNIQESQEVSTFIAGDHTSDIKTGLTLKAGVQKTFN